MAVTERIGINAGRRTSPPGFPLSRRRRLLLAALAQLCGKSNVDGLVAAIRDSARLLASAEGIMVVHREGAEVRYVAEDAVAPLQGQRFALSSCAPGLAMTQNMPVVIPDIYADARVPHDAYRSTFVRSMAVFPIGLIGPVWAIGAYWAAPGPIDAETIILLSSLARSAAFAFERLNF